MRRLHLFELEDQPWFPATIRDLATDYLHFMQNAGALHRGMVPFIEEALRGGGTTHIVDLCSGGSGPIPAILDDLRKKGMEVTATLTDLYPNVPALEHVAAGAGRARCRGSFAACAPSSTASIISVRKTRKPSCAMPPVPGSRLRSSRCRADPSR
jgi:hypothetical protein